jgi:hypothetical protein
MRALHNQGDTGGKCAPAEDGQEPVPHLTSDLPLVLFPHAHPFPPFPIVHSPVNRYQMEDWVAAMDFDKAAVWRDKRNAVHHKFAEQLLDLGIESS